MLYFFFCRAFLFLILGSSAKQWCTERCTERCIKLSHQPGILNVPLFLKHGGLRKGMDGVCANYHKTYNQMYVCVKSYYTV